MAERFQSRIAAVPPGASSALGPFIEAGVFGPTEVHLVAAVARLHPDATPLDLLALAAATRAPELGHVCVDVREPARLALADRADSLGDPANLPWPDADQWLHSLASSPLVAHEADADAEPRRPLVLRDELLYLNRYWNHERNVAADLLRRADDAAVPEATTGSATPARPGTVLEPGTVLDQLFGTGPDDAQRRAAATALERRLVVLSGGPGTGKTRTVARLIAAAVLSGRCAPQHIALAAPTGKAAARMGEAIALELEDLVRSGTISSEDAERIDAARASTLHRLLGTIPGGGFRHGPGNRLPHRLIVIDETSMVSLPLMANTLAALRDDATVVLVGDPFQLASVEAGSVMADIVGPARDVRDESALQGRLAPATVVLRTVHRFAADSGIARLAEAVRTGDADAAIGVLRTGGSDLSWVEQPLDAGARTAVEALVMDAAIEACTAARDGDAHGALAAATRIKVLAATRHHPLGLADWNQRIEEAVIARVGLLRPRSGWYPGRPVIVTANDRLNRVTNGDVGITLEHDGLLEVHLAAGAERDRIAAARLDAVETWWAMTIHKSQGSEFEHAVVSLPAHQSPIVTRELLYTGITRARTKVTVLGSEETVRRAIAQPVARASDLRRRLWEDHDSRSPLT